MLCDSLGEDFKIRTVLESDSQSQAYWMKNTQPVPHKGASSLLSCWGDLRVLWLSLLIPAQALTPPVDPWGEAEIECLWPFEGTAASTATVENEQGSPLPCPLCSEPIRWGMQPCYTDLTTAETFSGRSSYRKDALGNRCVPVIWAKVFPSPCF